VKRFNIYIIIIFCIIIIFGIRFLFWGGPITTVILVRHAEKATTPVDDPPLSAVGEQRAEDLTRVVAKEGIDVVFATSYQRTQQTVAPIASDLGLVPQIIDDFELLIDIIESEYSGQQILIAGHSNTIPLITEALRITEPLQIDEHEYDNLYVVYVSFNFPRRIWITKLQYGLRSP
jgi:broad specificity phosphatase PhoE